MILVYASQRDYDAMAGKPAGDPGWTRPDFAAMGEFMESFGKDLAESGELVDTRGLTAPAHARRIELQAASPVVTDGPYAEAEEVLAGYWIVECDSFDRATQIAARPADPGPEHVRARAYADVRPLADSRHELDGLCAPCRVPGSRTCCASWRRKFSARWPGDTGTSTRRGRRPGGTAGSGHPVARRRNPGQPARLADHGRLPAADRPAPGRAGPAPPGGNRRPPDPAARVA